jgi:hypothetical protein
LHLISGLALIVARLDHLNAKELAGKKGKENENPNHQNIDT